MHRLPYMKTRLLIFLLPALMLMGCEETIPPGRRYEPVETPQAKCGVLVEEYLDGTNDNAQLVLSELERVFNTSANLEQGAGVVSVAFYLGGPLAAAEAEHLVPEGINPPQARVNRQSELLDCADWPRAVMDMIGLWPKARFCRSLTVTKAGGELTVNGQAEAFENIPQARLHIWLVEDKVDGNDNVFRACCNGLKGSEFGLVRHTPREFTFVYPLSNLWNAENLRVVAFIETETGGVINAMQNHIIL